MNSIREANLHSLVIVLWFESLKHAISPDGGVSYLDRRNVPRNEMEMKRWGCGDVGMWGCGDVMQSDVSSPRALTSYGERFRS